jgi:HEAT repeat protein
MSERILPQHDTRSVDELIEAALTALDEEVAWDSTCALHWRGTAEVLGRAQLLCRSDCSEERRLGANILGQLGVPDRTFPSECAALLFTMLDSEIDADVLQAIFSAFGHLHESKVIAVAPQYAKHPDSDVRFAVVLALTGHEDEAAVDLLIALSDDSDSDVRDWATFGLGTQLKLDTPQIRNALTARLDDPDDDARGEAMIGLAYRRDRRAIPAIKKDLESCVTEKAVEAAAIFESPELLPALIALRGLPGISSTFLEGAISDCTPH